MDFWQRETFSWMCVMLALGILWTLQFEYVTTTYVSQLPEECDGVALHIQDRNIVGGCRLPDGTYRLWDPACDIIRPDGGLLHEGNTRVLYELSQREAGKLYQTAVSQYLTSCT